MWINATCHSYLLPQFDVNPMFVPTVVFYLPDKDKSAHLIGKFDKPSILKHQEKFVTGKLPTFPMPAKARDIQIRDIVCPKVMPEAVVDAASDSEGNAEDKELEDEILKEILREDEERRKKREKEERDIKKRGGKGKKKKNKDKKKEDL